MFLIFSLNGITKRNRGSILTNDMHIRLGKTTISCTYLDNDKLYTNHNEFAMNCTRWEFPVCVDCWHIHCFQNLYLMYHVQTQTNKRRYTRSQNIMLEILHRTYIHAYIFRYTYQYIYTIIHYYICCTRTQNELRTESEMNDILSVTNKKRETKTGI